MDSISWISLYIIENRKNNQSAPVRSGWPDRSGMLVVLVLVLVLGMCHPSRALGRLTAGLGPWLWIW